MLLRATSLLVLLVAVSVLLSYVVGEKVLIALGLLFLQIQILAKKAITLEWPAVVLWLKANTALFLRVEILKKWITTSIVPLIMGSVLRRRIASWGAFVRDAIAGRYTSLMTWYGELGRVEKVLTALIMLAAMLALSLSSVGLWLILFSVKAPIWVLAVLATLARSVWQTLSKMTFRAIGFFNLGLIWALVQWGLPERLLERKRKFEFRVARMVVRKRRLTLRELGARKDTLSLKWAVFREGLRQVFRRDDS